MPSSYTPNLGLEQPATGEQAGTWGNTANNDYSFLDTGIDGNLTITLSASSYNLNTAQGATSQGRNKVIIWTGTLTSQSTVNITPNTAQKLYIMTNATSGGFAIVFQQGTGGTFTLNAGSSAIIYCDGAGAAARVDGALYNPQFGSVVVEGNLTVSAPSTFSQPVTFSNNVQLNTPGFTPAQGDIYYRQASGNLAPLGVGAPGQFLQAQSGAGLAWASVAGLSIGTPVGGSKADCIFYANASNQLSQDANIYINPGVGIGIGLSPSGYGLQVGYAYSPSICLDTTAPGTQQRGIVFGTSHVLRWQLLTPLEAGEPGTGNGGSNLALTAMADTGALLYTTLYCTRATGNVTIGTTGDQGAKLSVFSTNTTQPVVRVRGAVSQGSYLQTWENSAGTRVASIDPTGLLYLANDPFVVYSPPYNRVAINPNVAGAPLGDLHIGTSGGGTHRGSIVLEMAPPGTEAFTQSGLCRIYFRNSNFVIQYMIGGVQYYLYVLLQAANGTATWTYTNTAQL
jgi:hypothetical protein